MDQRSRWPVSRPFVFVTVWFLLAGTQLLLNSVRPPMPTTNVHALGILAAITFAMAAVSIACGIMLRNERVLTVLMLAGAVLLTATTWLAASGQGQLMAAFYLVVLALIGALFLARRFLMVVLGATIVGYAVALILNPRLDSPGYAVFAIIVIVLVALSFERLVHSLRHRALHDELTGALNRHGLESSARLAHGLALREGRETTVVEIDLDRFKEYNDAHGHLAGDQLLADVVRDWSGVLRRTDLLSRTGGDEFVLVLPGTTSAEVETLIERMRAANAAEWSVGSTTWSPDLSLPAAIDRADEAMYREKANRRTPPPG